MSELTDKTTIVVGASRGLGRGIATALAQEGAPVIAVARSGVALAELAQLADGLTRGHPALHRGLRSGRGAAGGPGRMSTG